MGQVNVLKKVKEEVTKLKEADSKQQEIISILETKIHEVEDLRQSEKNRNAANEEYLKSRLDTILLTISLYLKSKCVALVNMIDFCQATQDQGRGHEDERRHKQVSSFPWT